MRDIAGFGALLAVGRQSGSAARAIRVFFRDRLDFRSPEDHDLIEFADLGREYADRLAEMPNLDRQTPRPREVSARR
jgi:hypothetical protein